MSAIVINHLFRHHDRRIDSESTTIVQIPIKVRETAAGDFGPYPMILFEYCAYNPDLNRKLINRSGIHQLRMLVLARGW